MLIEESVCVVHALRRVYDCFQNISMKKQIYMDSKNNKSLFGSLGAVFKYVHQVYLLLADAVLDQFNCALFHVGCRAVSTDLTRF